MSSMIEQFRSIEQLKTTMDMQISSIQKKVEEYSKIIGEKIRTLQESTPEDADVVALKEKLGEEPQDAKKKKKSTKKENNSQWFDLSGLYVYNGVSTKGEVELYFKAIEGLKTKLVNLQKTKESIEGLVTKGLKNNVDCIGLQRPDSFYEIVFKKSQTDQHLFKYHSNFEIGCEAVTI